MRFGTVSIVGRPNVGKTTLLNAALGEPLAVVSPVPQTTRATLLGVVHREQVQIAFLDTPGLHRPKNELGRRMNASALDAARSADVVVVMTDVGSRTKKRALPETGPVDPDDQALIETVRQSGHPLVLVVNKVDLVRSKERLLPILEAYGKLAAFDAVIPGSMRNDSDVQRVLKAIEAHLPEGEAGYPEDTLTDRPTNFFVREYVREQVLRLAGREVPHAVAVSVDQVEQTPQRWRIMATIHVDKVGQRKILVGRGGTMIREIGTHARQRISELVGAPVHLELFVRVTPRWRNAPRQLAELGYEASEGRAALPDAFERSSSTKGGAR